METHLNKIYPGHATSPGTVSYADTITADGLAAAYQRALDAGMVDVVLYAHPFMQLPDEIPTGLLIVLTE